MKILVTAGNTVVPIDRVRCITNVFSGRTGTSLAVHAHARGHQVTLLTSHPEVVRELAPSLKEDSRWSCLAYRTFADLETLMERNIAGQLVDAVLHCAAVNDYQTAGIYAPAPGSRFGPDLHWHSDVGSPALLCRDAGKVKSDEPELWLRLVRTPKLIDRVRTDWRFGGLLVKFKLEVDVTAARLVEIAEQSRRQSAADWMVANIYDGGLSSCYLGPVAGRYECIPREDLPERLLGLLEPRHQERRHG